MNKQDYLKSADDMIYLIYCVINGIKPDINKIKEMNLSYIYIISKSHMLTAVTAFALESVGINEHDFTQAKGKSMRKNALLDMERANLISFFEENGIWYMPLKGVIMQDYYPIYGMRQMTDNDILFDKNFRSQVKKYFTAKQYVVKKYGMTNHDVYIKQPVINFEMHISLVGENQPVFYNYYKNIKDRLINTNGCEYRFTNEDFYIFMKIHEFKHYNSSGIGLRSLLDTYVFIEKNKDTLDFNYIERECKKIGIDDYEEKLRSLSQELFSKNKLSETNREIFEYMLFSGSFGNYYNIVNKKMIKIEGQGKTKKIKYIIRRIFLPVSILKKYYPIFFRYKILLPLLPFWRIIKLFTFRRDKVRAEMKALISYEKKNE